MARLHLKPNRERSLLRHHPWIFSGAVQKIEGPYEGGTTVQVISSSGQWLATAALSPQSQIIARVWSFDQEEKIDSDFFRSKIEKAIHYRKKIFVKDLPSACRLVFSESDGLPGLIIDKYTEFLVCQFLSAGIEYWKDTIIDLLGELAPYEGLFERSDVEVRKKEGLELHSGLLKGMEPPALTEIMEGNCKFLVDIKSGQKTGFYLDQFENRKIIAEYTQDKEVLNAFSYTGSFSVVALKNGARSVTNIDTSGPALETAKQHIELNGLDRGKIENIEGDVFEVLRTFRDSGRQFDMIILDPPKFAESQSQLDRATRGYKDINLLAFKLLKPGGMLVTFSCSGIISRELFEKIVAGAALDAGRKVTILRWLTQSPDHPVTLNFPESLYLKGLICRVME